MPCQGIEMNDVFDSHVETIMNARTFNNNIITEEVTARQSRKIVPTTLAYD